MGYVSVGFDDMLNREISVTFDGTDAYEKAHGGSLGLGLLNCRDREKKTHTLIHHMTEVHRSPTDGCNDLLN